MKKFELGSLMCAVILGTYFLSGTVYAEESLSEFVLDGINVTALGYEKNNLDTPADTVIYTGEQLKETGAGDVANALKYKGGVYFTNMGPHDQNWITGSSQINLRGIDGGTLVLINGVDVVLGAEQKSDLLRYLGNLQKHEEGEAFTTATKDIRSFSPSCSRGDRTRFFLKVQDGCDYFCSYCTIPFARGRSRNGTIASMVEQAGQAAAEGGKEIVLTGVNIGDFGKTTGETFFDLVKALDQVEGIERYRISSIEPNLLTDEIIEFVSRSRSFMPHFHIPLQSGSDEVLKLMRRRYDTALFASKVKKIKEVMPDAFIGVDVIVGTRGETEEYFEEAYQFIAGLDVTQLHVFSYSERPGTQALKIDYVVSPEEKHQRSQRLLALSDEKTQAFYARHIGQTMSVLMEKSKAGTPMHGFTENYIRVEVEADNSLDNQVINVRLGDFNEDKTALKGTILI
mgnify:CR=1 FL=1